jgi:hypothetical protein
MPAEKKKKTYQEEYNSDPKPGKPSVRTVRMDNNTTFGTKRAYIQLDPGLVTQAVEDAIKGALEPILAKMAEEAIENVHVGGEHDSVYLSGPSAGQYMPPRDPRDPYATGKHAGKPYTARKPGTLKASIRYSVHARKDRTAVLGFFEAGGDNTDYAFVEELGIGGTTGTKRGNHAFLRPAFNKYADAAVKAVEDALAQI